MSHFLDRLKFLKKVTDTFSGGHGIVTNEDRGWEDAYRARWQHDKIVRSTHGVNCTGSCSWKIYVKNGLVTWETQQTDYPRTRDDLPNHEPRGCARGASYSWYLYSANRVKYPMIRGRLIKLWRAALAVHKDPVAAWASIVEDPAKATEYKSQRGLGGFVRSTWDEVNPIIAAANVYTAKQYGPDRIYGFSPIPAMSMVSYAAGSRYLSLIGGACGSFYDWYCDLPPASPMVWGEQTDVPESADWYNSTFLNDVGFQRAADPHPGRPFHDRSALQGRQDRGGLPGLFGSLQVRRHLAASEAGHRRRRGDGDGPCHPARVPSRREERTISPTTSAPRPIFPSWCCWISVRMAATSTAASCAPPIWPATPSRPTIPNGRRWLSTKTATN
jgi:nitrate reductase alpha subunit